MSKKIIALVAPIMLCLAPLTHAAVLKNCDKDGLACERSSFDLGLTALYLKAYSDLFPSNSLSTSNSSDNFSIGSINQSGRGLWDWGGIIDGRYHFSDRSDVNLNWMYYSVSYRGTDFSSNTFNSADGFNNNDNNGIEVTSGRIKLNSVNAELAQSFDPSPRGIVRLFAGAQYLNIKNRSRNATFFAEDSNSGETITNSKSSTYTDDKYEGAGPRAGLDAKYILKGNLSVFASSAATILLGRSTHHVSSGSSATSTSIFAPTSTNVSDALSFSRSYKSVPELEAKLGLTYDQPLARAMVSLSAGWSVINYFNALEGNDLALSGPYIQGKWVG